MRVKRILDQFHDIATNPRKQMDAYLAAGEKVVLTAPVYAPEELIRAMGLIPMGVWGADIPLERSKEYFPAFICSIMQSILELGIQGKYDGASAIVIPSLCDSLKCLGENWKYAVPGIPFVPMTYPQNRDSDAGRAFIKANYERVGTDLERITGAQYSQDGLIAAVWAYNVHNETMRRMDEVLSKRSDITASQRSDIFKSAFFMRKEDHTNLMIELMVELEERDEIEGAPEEKGVKIMTSGILCDSPALLEIFDDLGLHIVADDVAAESRQYRVDVWEALAPEDGICDKFSRMDHCSVLYDPEKKRADLIVETAKARGAKGVVVVLTKFCDPEEFDYPIIKKACDAAGLPVVQIEVDRQMSNFEQARTLLEAFRDSLV